jgi:glycosyltransferase involved in cell wall biosynthesis
MISPKMEKKRVLYLSSSRFPTQKAYGYQIVKECESLAGLGLDVRMIFPEMAPRQARNMGLPRNPDLATLYSVKNNFRLQPEAINPILDLFYSDTSAVWPFLKILSFAFRSGILVKKHRSRNGTLIWTQDFYTILVQLIIGIRPEDALVFECHDVPKKLLALFAPFIRKLNKIIVTTSGLRREFQKIGFGEERILVLPNAVSMDDFSIEESREDCRQALDLPLNRPVIGYVGMFQTYGLEKGIPTLIQSLSYLQKRLAPPPLLICVGGPIGYAEKYYRIADETGVPRERIRFVDFQPRSQVPRWMKACDVCTIPSPLKKFFMEYASPMKLFEYLAAGVPVVASDIPAIRDIIQDGKNGLLVTAEDPQAWAAGISRILEDQVLAAELVRAGHETIKNNSWKQRAERAYSFIMHTAPQDEESFSTTDA